MRLGILFRRELDLAWSAGGGPLLACAFYAGAATLMALALGPAPERLAAAAAGSAWLALALSSLLSLERLFERDFEDGALDLLALGPAPLELVCAVKCLAQWAATSLPLAALAPIIAIALGATPGLAPLIFLAALVGGLGFSFTGGMGAALALASRRGGLLIAVIVLPLYAPPAIFGGAAIDAFASGLDWRTGLLVPLAWSLAAIAIGPIAMAAAVRNAQS